MAEPKTISQLKAYVDQELDDAWEQIDLLLQHREQVIAKNSLYEELIDNHQQQLNELAAGYARLRSKLASLRKSGR